MWNTDFTGNSLSDQLCAIQTIFFEFLEDFRELRTANLGEKNEGQK
jgi:hypothetical protein